jgi:hypothetical protein
MTFQEALEIREQDRDLEHYLRAAKIVDWLVNHEEIKEDEVDDVFATLVDEIANSEDEFDSLVYGIIEDIREQRSEKD